MRTLGLVLLLVAVTALVAVLWRANRGVDRARSSRRAAPPRRISPPPPPSEAPSAAQRAGTPSIDFFSAARASPFDALQRLQRGDVDGARAALQKIAYIVHGERRDLKPAFTALMNRFVELDPLFDQGLGAALPHIKAQPGIRQTALYPHMGMDAEACRYVLYFAETTGRIRRIKWGNSYRVYLPGDEPATDAPAARSRKASGRRKSTGANVKRFELQQQLVERTLGLALESTRPVDMSIEEVTQALWPLNERFRPHLAQIQSLAYDQRLEGAADGAVERLVLHGAAWDGEPSGVWRVLLERHLQVMQLLALKAGEAGSWTAPFLSVPEPADAALRARLAIVFVLHSTPLPFAVAERSGAALPQGNAPGTLTRH